MATTGLKKRLHKNMHLPFDEVPTCYSDTACVTRIPVSRSCRETKKKETYDLQESDCSDSKIIHIKTSTGPCEIKHNYTTNLDHNLSDTNESDSLLFRISNFNAIQSIENSKETGGNSHSVNSVHNIPNLSISPVFMLQNRVLCQRPFLSK